MVIAGAETVEAGYFGGVFWLTTFSFTLGPHRPLSNLSLVLIMEVQLLGAADGSHYYNNGLSIPEYTSIFDGRWFLSIHQRLLQLSNSSSRACFQPRKSACCLVITTKTCLSPVRKLHCRHGVPALRLCFRFRRTLDREEEVTTQLLAPGQMAR